MSIKRAFSLVEVLVFITILSLFLIAAAAIITATMRQSSVKIDMLKATHYNAQLLEWIHGERDQDWNTFVTRANSAGITYCFTANSFFWSATSCAYDLEGKFKRVAILKSVGVPPTQVEIYIQTDWSGMGNVYSTKLHSVYTLWE